MPRTHRPSACYRSVLSTFALLLLCAAALVPADAARDARAAAEKNPAPRQAPAPDARRLREAYGRLPLRFEVNRGQTDRRVKFLSRGEGYALFLTADEAVLALGGDDSGRGSVLRMRLGGANRAPRVEALEELPGRQHYFASRDPRRWRADVETYGRVLYRGVYPGTDLVYYGNQRQLEYDFRLAPGADPSLIKLKFDGADRVEIDDAGDLLLHTAAGVVRQHKPFLYQEVGGARREVAGRYVLRGPREVGFRVGVYDRARALVIDPVLVYSTYLGGSGRAEEANDIAVDATGAAYVVGTVSLADFPTTAGAFQAAPHNQSAEVFVTKLSPEGNALVYSTLLGGTGSEAANSVAIDAEGHAYVAGSTDSHDFPTTPGAFQPALAGDADAFLVKLNPSGSALVYSTFIGGSRRESAHVAVDAAGFAYVGGGTASADFPVTPGSYDTTFGPDGATGDAGDAFALKLNQTGNALVYSTFLGGTGQDAAQAVALDAGGHAYLAGITAAGTDASGQVGPNDFPTTPGAFQRDYASAGVAASDAFVAKLTADGTALVYSTYLGGKWEDYATGLAVDAAGHAYVAGTTDTLDFPVRNAFQPALANSERVDDAFVTKLNPEGSGLVYSTYLGGDAADAAYDLALDAAGQAHVVGSTNSFFFPVRNAFQGRLSNTFEPTLDAFVTRLNPDGTLDYSTYFGGRARELGSAVAVGPDGDAFFAGRTSMIQSTRAEPIPIVNAYQPERRGLGDAFVARLRVGEDEPTYALRGRVTTPDGRGLAGAAINVRGSVTMRRTTDAEGFYVVDGLRAGGSYAVNAFKMFYISAPQEHVFDSLGADQTADFVATPQHFHISGRVTDASGANGIAGITVELGGALNSAAQTDAGGNYSFQGLPGGRDYTVRAVSAQHTFEPPTRAYAFLNQDQHFASFYATPVTPAPTPTPTPAAVYTIAGQVTVSGAPVSGVTVTLEGTHSATATTGADGRYAFNNLWAGGSYTVRPPQSAYNYAPQQHSFTMLGGNQTANFEGTAPRTLVNHALAANGATATASSTLDSNRAALAAINGDRKGQNWGGNPATGSGWHDATSNSYPDWLEVSFNGAKTVQQVNVFSVQDNVNAPAEPTQTMTFTKYGVVNFRVMYWDAAASAWADVPGEVVYGNNQVWRPLTFAPVRTTKLRLVIDGAQAGYSRVTEFEAWGEPAAGTTPPPVRVNHALAANGATATASSTMDPNRAPLAAINGDRRGQNWGGSPATGSGWHDATANAHPDWLEVSFNGAKTVDEVNLFSVQDAVTAPSEPTEAMAFTKYGVTGFQVEYWTGSAWSVVPGGLVASNNKVWVKLTFAPVTTTKLRVVITGALAGYSRIAEFEAWGLTEAPARLNVAAAANGATATASSTLDSNRAPLAAINGDRRGQNWGANPATGSGWHDATSNSYPDWLEVSFNGAKTISEVSVFSVQDNVTAPAEPTDLMTFTKHGVTSFDVEYWNGASWQIVPGGMVTGNDRVWRKVTFAPLTTTKLRVVSKGALAGYSRLAEVEAY